MIHYAIISADMPYAFPEEALKWHGHLNQAIAEHFPNPAGQRRIEASYSLANQLFDESAEIILGTREQLQSVIPKLAWSVGQSACLIAGDGMEPTIHLITGCMVQLAPWPTLAPLYIAMRSYEHPGLYRKVRCDGKANP